MAIHWNLLDLPGTTTSGKLALSFSLGTYQLRKLPSLGAQLPPPRWEFLLLDAVTPAVCLCAQLPYCTWKTLFSCSHALPLPLIRPPLLQ